MSDDTQVVITIKGGVVHVEDSNARPVPPSPDDPLLVDVTWIREKTGLSRSFIHNKVTSGELPARKAGVRLVFTYQDVLNWIASLPSSREAGVA